MHIYTPEDRTQGCCCNAKARIKNNRSKLLNTSDNLQSAEHKGLLAWQPNRVSVMLWNHQHEYLTLPGCSRPFFSFFVLLSQPKCLCMSKFSNDNVMSLQPSHVKRLHTRHTFKPSTSLNALQRLTRSELFGDLMLSVITTCCTRHQGLSDDLPFAAATRLV